jgi:hypothetical protein
MLGHLCLAVAQHGKPHKRRTDNEAVLIGVPLTQNNAAHSNMACHFRPIDQAL